MNLPSSGICFTQKSLLSLQYRASKEGIFLFAIIIFSNWLRIHIIQWFPNYKTPLLCFLRKLPYVKFTQSNGCILVIFFSHQFQAHFHPSFISVHPFLMQLIPELIVFRISCCNLRLVALWYVMEIPDHWRVIIGWTTNQPTHPVGTRY